jgi:prevent-host-death family protein
MKVGTKRLKNKLSYYLRRVKAGETVTVTDRGVPVAELRSVETSEDAEERALRRLEEEGLLTRGSGKLRPFKPVKLKNGVRLSATILEDRR